VPTRPITFTSSVLPARDRGLELGERFRAEVTAHAAAYRALFERRADRPFDVDEWSARAWESIRALAPEAAEEIAGIAEGAGRPVEEVAAVNARTELLVAANPSGLSECSTVIALPPGAAPVAVQTWDWYDAMSDGWFHWTIPHEDGRVVQTVTEWGMLGKIGVSSAGVAVMLNMLHHENDAKAAAEERIGYPVHLLARAILDRAGSYAEARSIASAATSASTSLTVVDRDGAGGTIELFPGGPGVLEPEDGLLVRTNHFVSEAGAPGCLASTISDSTEFRRTALLDALTATPPTSAADVVAAMECHRDDGAGVCSHPRTEDDPLLWHRTLATVCLDVATGSLTVRDGGPCGERLRP